MTSLRVRSAQFMRKKNSLALARLGKRRRIVVAVPHFLIAPHIVA